MGRFLAIVLALLFMQTNLQAQINKRAKADKDTKAWRYEVECVGVGQQGTSLVKIWSYSKKPKVALEQAKKNAVHAITFKGLAAGSNGCMSQRALVRDPGVEDQKEQFFDEFFSDGGKFEKFVTISGDGAVAAGDRIKVGKEYKVGVIVVVNHAALRKDLEAAGVIKSLSHGF